MFVGMLAAAFVVPGGLQLVDFGLQLTAEAYFADQGHSYCLNPI